MARNISAAYITEVTAKQLRPIFLVKLAFDSGDLNLWNGIGDFTFEGDTYTGAGDLGNIGEMTETGDIKATGLSFSLSGVNSAILSSAQNEDFQERSAKVWMIVLDDNNAIIDSFLVFDGRMDTMIIEEGGFTDIITVTAETVLISLERPNERRYTPEDQKKEFPNDTFFDRVADLQDAIVTLQG